jgi:hypothetical protein
VHLARELVASDVDGGHQAEQHIYGHRHRSQQQRQLDCVQEVGVQQVLQEYGRALMERLGVASWPMRREQGSSTRTGCRKKQP